jgi:hypothetical protein
MIQVGDVYTSETLVGKLNHLMAPSGLLRVRKSELGRVPDQAVRFLKICDRLLGGKVAYQIASNWRYQNHLHLPGPVHEHYFDPSYD